MDTKETRPLLQAEAAVSSPTEETKRPPPLSEPAAASVNVTIAPKAQAPAPARAPASAAKSKLPASLRHSCRSSTLIVILMFGAFLGVLLLVINLPQDAATDGISEGVQIDTENLRSMCKRMEAPAQPTGNFALVMTFAVQNLRTNDTTIVRVSPERRVQMIDVLHGGAITRRVLVQFEDERASKTLYMFNGPNAPIPECELDNSGTNEINWLALVCDEQGDQLLLNAQDMLMTRQPIFESYASFAFDIVYVYENKCKRRRLDSPDAQDVTTPVDEQAQVAFERGTLIKLPLETALTHALNLIVLEHGAAYAESPALVARLVEAHSMLERAFENTTALARANQTALYCDTELPACQRLLLTNRVGAAYMACATELSIDNEPNCVCNSVTADAISKPGHNACGDCAVDRDACECYMASVLQLMLLQQRPCSCAGTCTRGAPATMATLPRTCTGALLSKDKCSVQIEWRPVLEPFPCWRRHITPIAAFAQVAPQCQA